ncbi:FHA domain-containing protein [Wenzhouxiangella marina]|uniref:Uncharacterized protein n=1 Tax=Wenzhouxiangella marina TaxID=1579979 RepID=A0A0K0XUR0_9GAMM|nr:FHA domain-containing protein [Wenzhouxiangella marina]AKS41449.1 hypothetical protein WM2015_1073 [Wenzhouxiangella marina]MBB6086796.1 hypothetical protein [Wenzhouxiangella marina]
MMCSFARLSLCLLCLSLASSLHASGWNTLVVGDIQADTLPPEHPAWRSADRAIAQALIERGFDVFDKSALGLVSDCEAAACEGYKQADFVRLARELNRTARQPMDLMVVYSVTVTTRSGPGVDRVQVRLPGKMVDIDTGRLVDQWDGSLMEFVEPAQGCVDGCLRQWLADRARQGGQELGAVLAEKLAAYVREFYFRLDLRDFTPGEREAILAGLRAAPDYRQGALRELGSGARTREWLHHRVTASYELATPLRAGALRQRVEGLIEQAGARGSVSLRGSDSLQDMHLEAVRQGFPYAGRYTAGLISPLLLGLLAFIAWRYRLYDRTAADLASTDRPSEGLRFLDQTPLPGLPRRGRWTALREDWQRRMAEADSALKRAEAALDRVELDEAGQALAQAATAASDHPRLPALQARLQKQSEAADLLIKARAVIDEDPSRASKWLHQARALDPSLAEPIGELIEQAEAHLRSTVLTRHRQAAEAALKDEQWLRAASQAGQALFAIRGLEHFDADAQALTSLRDQALARITPQRGDAHGTGDLKDTWLLTGDEIQVGRARGVMPGAITMNYKRISRVGKQLRIKREGGRLFAVDPGSTHGSMADDVLLANGQPRRLSAEAVVALGGGREPPRPGAARLIIEVPEDASASAIVRLDRFQLKLLNSDDLALAWPTMREDVGRCWLLVRDGLPVHAAADRIVPGRPAGDEPGLLIGHDDGYWAAPIDDTPDERVCLDGEVLAGRTPLAEGVMIQLGDRRMQLQGDAV